MSDKSMRDGWLKYRTEVMEPIVGRVQLQETRRAFYAGAVVMMALTVKASNLPELEAVAEMEKLSQELDAFNAIVGTPAEQGS